MDRIEERVELDVVASVDGGAVSARRGESRLDLRFSDYAAVKA
jgi:hypothetical protein